MLGKSGDADYIIDVKHEIAKAGTSLANRHHRLPQFLTASQHSTRGRSQLELFHVGEGG